MPAESLLEPLNNAISQARFIDVYRNHLEASHVLYLYEKMRKCPLNSTDAIAVPQRDLDALSQEIRSLLGAYVSSNSNIVGNGLYTVTGSLSSPRRPTCEEYAKILVLAASRIGAGRVAELLEEWIQGKKLRVFVCVLLKGLLTEGRLQPVPGMTLDTLPNNGDLLPRSLRIDDREHYHEQYTTRTILSVECETVPALYDPEEILGNPPFPSAPPTPLNPELSAVSFESFCRAISLTTNNHVDWFILWEDYGDVEAFFLNPGFSCQRKEASNTPIITVTEGDVRSCLDIHAKLDGRSDLNLAIARWRRSKRANTEYEKLIDLRIALESVLLNENSGTAEKSFRLASRGAWLLGETFDGRESHFETLRHTYAYASSVIHGGTPKIKKDRNLKSDITNAQNFCRDAILKLTTTGKALNNADWSALILGGEM